MTLFKQNTLLVFQFKNFIDNRSNDNEIIVTSKSAKIIKFVIFNQTKFVEFNSLFIATKSIDKNRFTSIKSIYIINWIIDRIKFRKNLRTFKNIVKSLLLFDNISRFFARNNFIDTFNSSKSKKSKTTRRSSHTFDIIAKKNIYKHFFRFEIVNFYEQYVRSISRRSYTTTDKCYRW